MKLAARYKFDDIRQVGRLFYIMGPADNPRIGTIYDDRNRATDYTPEEVEAIKERFADDFVFYTVEHGVIEK